MAEVTETLPGHAGGLQPADRAADQRDGRRHPRRPRHQALRRRPGGPEGEGRRDRAGRRGRSPAPPTSPPSRSPASRSSASRSTARPSPATASRPRQVLDAVEAAGGHHRRRGPRARPPVPAGRPPADVLPRRPERPGADPHPHRLGRAAAADPARPPGRDRPAPRRSSASGAAADRRPGQRPGPRPRLVRRGGPGAGSTGRCSSRPATRSSGAASSRTSIRAERRLLIVVPLALALILSLLYLTFHSLRDALMIFSGVLFARVGGVFGLWIRGMPFTISAGVGFVALAGASMLEGLVLVSYIRDRMAHGVPKREAIEQARLARLRPVLMTGTGRGPRLRADDALDRHRRRGPAPAGHGRRLRHGLRHVPDHARPARPLPPLRQGPRAPEPDPSTDHA